MADVSGLDPSLPPRPTIIGPSRDEGEEERENVDVPKSAPPRPAAPHPMRPSSNALPQQASNPQVPPLDHPAPSRPQPMAAAPTKAPTTNSSTKGGSTKRSRPVITVVEARPMNQVGFRDMSPTGPKPGGKERPEITVVAARPMSEVAFRTEGRTSPSVEATTPSLTPTPSSTEPKGTSVVPSADVTMREKPKRAAPPRPASMPARPAPPRIPSVQQQHASAQNLKLPGAYGDRILVISPEAEAKTLAEQSHGERRAPPPPRPVSRPQSLRISADHKGVEEDTPSESSGYSSQVTTSESHSSLSSVESPSKAPPPRKKPIGIQVLPIGPGMLPLRGSLKSPASPKEQEEHVITPPIPSPRAVRKHPAPPSPAPRQRNISPPEQPITEREVVSEHTHSIIEGESCREQPGVMELPPVPKLRAPSPRPRTPRPEVSQPQCAETPSEETMKTPAGDNSENAEIEINPWADINQNEQKIIVADASLENQGHKESIDHKEIVVSPAESFPCPPISPPRPKPKPSPKPKPVVAAKPKTPTMPKPPRQAPTKPMRRPEHDQPPREKLYPSLSLELNSEEDQASKSDYQSVKVSPCNPIISSGNSTDDVRVDSSEKVPARPPPRPQSPQKKIQENISEEIECKNLARPHTPELSHHKKPPPRPPSLERTASEKPQSEPLSEPEQLLQESKQSSNSSIDIPIEMTINSVQETDLQQEKCSDQPSQTEVKEEPAGEHEKQSEIPEELQEKLYPEVTLSSEMKTSPSLPRPTDTDLKENTLSKNVTAEQKANDSFSDDDDAADPFYTKRNGQSVVDTSLFSIMAPKHENESETSTMKRYFSETEIREKENTDPAVAFYRDRPEILATDAPKPTRIKRPTIIRPKKATAPVSPEEGSKEANKDDDSADKTPSEEPKHTSPEPEPIEEPPIIPPVIAKRPTIIRAAKVKTPSQEELPEVEKPVEVKAPPKKVPPPVKPKPKPKPGKPAQPLVRTPSKGPPPPTKPKPVSPPTLKPKPPSPAKRASQVLPSDNKEPAPPESTQHHSNVMYPPSPNVMRSPSPVVVRPPSPNIPRSQSPNVMRPPSPNIQRSPSPNTVPAPSPKAPPRRPPSGPQLSPSLFSKVQADITRSESISSLEETENKLNEMRVRSESCGSAHSDDKLPPMGTTIVSDSKSIDQESTDTPAETKRKSWVPPGAVRVMGTGGPPPLPRTGPVAVSTPDLRIDADSEKESTKIDAPTAQRSHSPPPGPVPERPVVRTRPKSMSMMSLHKSSFEQDRPAVPACEETIQEEATNKSVEPAVQKPTRPPPARPSRPSAPPRKTHSVSEEPGPAEKSETDPPPKTPPARPTSPSKKVPPARAPPPKISKVDRGPAPTLPERPGPGHPLYHYVVQGPHGIALFDYEATAEDELGFKAGDVIDLDEQVSESWMIGRNVDKKGMFPANFIDVIEAPPLSTSRKRESSVSSTEQATDITGSGPRCVARFDYDSEVDGDLTFMAGEVISLTGRMGDEWLKGNLNGKEGVFPIAFVEVVEDLPGPCDPGHLTEESSDKADNMVTAMYDFSGQAEDLSFKPEQPYCIADYDYPGEEGDLELKKGDQILLTGRISEDWLKGSIGGKEGTFPKAFVTVKKDLEEDNSTKEASKPTTPPTTSSASGKAIALHDFVGETEGDLSLKVGDEVVLLKKVSEDWFSGSIGEQQGMFPAGFVKVIQPLPDAASGPQESIA